MPTKEEILSIIREKGLVIPNQIKKIIGGETFLIGAILSELVKDKKIKISNTKIGNSPFYYFSEQKTKLLELKRFLNEKDRRTVDLLRDKKIIRDKNQELLLKVSLRNIKDFAKPLEVKVNGKKELFWKWFLSPLSEIEPIVKKLILRDKTILEEPKQKKIEEKIFKKENLETKKDVIKGEFIKKLHNYFDKKQIEIIEEKIIRKNSDVELQVLIPSAVGKMTYFCKAKNKKKCNDGDLSSAYIKGQTLKLPVMFITTGEITKKAKEMLNNEFKGLVLKRF